MEADWRQPSTPAPRRVVCDICGQDVPPGPLRCAACVAAAHEAIRRADGAVVRPSDILTARGG